jgi:hypothetical protein
LENCKRGLYSRMDTNAGIIMDNELIVFDSCMLRGGQGLVRQPRLSHVREHRYKGADYRAVIVQGV